MNLVVLRGNLTRDPELKSTSGGTQVCKFGLAVNEGYGEKKKAHFFDLTAFGKVAENLAKFKKKGEEVLISGRLDHQTWEAKDGSKRSKIEVIAFSVEFIGGKKKESSGEGREERAGGDGGGDGFDDGPKSEIPF